MKRLIVIIMATIILCGCTNKKVENTTIPVSNTIDPDKPVIALTFDDGPSKYTNEILDILNKYGASATFFVLGNKVEIYQQTMKKMIKFENEIGNHSYNHKWLSRLNDEELKEQISKTQDIIKEITNYTPNVFRPAYGDINKKVRDNIDLKIVLWTLDTMDWKLKNSKKIADRILKKVKDGDIILMHDTYERTLKAIKIIVPALIEEGYQFVTVSELEEIKYFRNNIQKQ